MLKHLAPITAAVALAAAAPAAAAPANQTGCEEFGNYALAAAGFDLGEQAVADHGDATKFVRPSRRSHGMIVCMAVDYNAGVAYARGVKGLPLPATGRTHAYMRTAYIAGLAQR